MCGDEWEARECQIARQALRKEWDKKVFGISKGHLHPISTVFLLFNIGIVFLSDFIK